MEATMRKRTSGALIAMLAVLLIGTPARAETGNSYQAARDLIAGFALGSNAAEITLQAGDYEVTATAEGVRLEMDAFGQLMVPGAPQLPMKRFLIALPPGAMATSVEVLGTRSVEIPGVFRIDPCPPIVFLPGMPRQDLVMERMNREWQAEHDARYLSDEPYPLRVAWLAGRGTLRKYAYASVAFCPFTYHPESGRLEYHSEVDVRIAYDLPAEGSAEAKLTEALMNDRVADEKAEEIFANYAEMSEQYAIGEPMPAPLSETYDYVIITVSGLVNSIETSDFPTWKAALGHNLRTVLTTDTEITSQPGVDLAEQIRNFLRSYYGTWGIEYVLFVGDYATVPMRICYPDSAFHVYDPSDPGLVAPGTPNDHYYADLSFPDAVSWDSDGDGYIGEYRQDNPDFMQEVAVGRIPVNNTTRIKYALNKMVAFEQDTGAWKENALLAGSILFFENQDYGGYPFIDGSTCLDSIGTGLMGSLAVDYMTEQDGIVTSTFPWPPISESAFNTSWRTGQYAYVNWSGHGWSDGAYRTCWMYDDGDGVPEHNGEMQSFQFIHRSTSNLDDDYPSIVFAISCNVGYPDPNPYGNCGIDLLTKLGWGSSAGIVSASRPAAISGDWKNSPGGTEQICYEFNRYMIVEGERVGDALYDGKFYATDNYGWDRTYEYMNLYNFNLYGDPALAVAGATAGIVDGRGDPTGSVLRLGPGEPNPFTSASTVRFALPAAGRLKVQVHDVRGRRVASLADGHYEAGQHAVTWDATGDAGERVGPGLYFMIFETEVEKASRKVVLLR
jgi:hypothetical protein